MKILKIDACNAEPFKIEKEIVLSSDQVYCFFCDSPFYLNTEEKEWNLTKNTAVFCKGPRHIFLSSLKDPSLFSEMVLTDVPSCLFESYQIEFQKAYSLKYCDHVHKILLEIEREQSLKSLYYMEKSKNFFENLLIAIKRWEKGDKNFLLSETKNQEKLYALKKALKQQYSEEWTTEKMSRFVHLSPSRFYDVYRDFFHSTPQKDLQNLRIKHAATLLESGDFSVGEVALLSGYQNIYHFIRQFKEEYGMSPGKYKNRQILP